MRRKIAFFLTCAVTLLFMVLRVIASAIPDITVGSFSLADTMIALALAAMLAITVLCFSRKSTLAPFSARSQSLLGWIATFCGALLAMSVILDTFCWVVYDQIPPPNSHILNSIDLYALILTLVCGLGGGAFLIMRGFCWMAQSEGNKTLHGWLSLTPVLWMWFRLARYEISYASTIDISESFFDFATLVTASLFFLQLTRTLTGIGAQPKNGLLIFSLFTAMISLSGAPLAMYRLSAGESIGTLLIAIVDAAIGLFALTVAMTQAFPSKATVATPSPEDGADMAWRTPAREHDPLDPPFALNDTLPVMQEDAVGEATETQELPAQTPQSPASSTDTLTVDDILAELNKTI